MGRVHAHVRPHVRAHVRSPLSGRAGGLSVHDGISFTASNGRVVIKAAGSAPTITTLTSAFTFTGGNQSYYRGPSGLLIASATNTPRIEYGPGGDVLGLLMEASKTNLCLQSATFGTSWIVSGATISSDATAAPDGTTTADKLVEGSGGTFHLVRQDIGISANTPYTFSVFIAPAGRTFCRVQWSDSTETNGAFIDVNLTTGATGTVTTFGAGTAAAATVTAYANGFYRVTIRCTVDASSVTGRVQILSASALGTVNYSGDGASGLFCWGGQLEAAQFASSYIPTTTVSVARTADSCIRTLGSEFSATAGTVVVAGRASGGQDATAAQVWSLDDASANNRTFLFRPGSSDAASLRNISATLLDVTLDGTFSNSTAFKSATAFAVNDYATSFNGAAVLTDTSAALPIGVTRCSLGQLAGVQQMNGHIRTFDYYPTRQPNEWLVARST